MTTKLKSALAAGALFTLVAVFAAGAWWRGPAPEPFRASHPSLARYAAKHHGADRADVPARGQECQDCLLAVATGDDCYSGCGGAAGQCDGDCPVCECAVFCGCSSAASRRQAASHLVQGESWPAAPSPPTGASAAKPASGQSQAVRQPDLRHEQGGQVCVGPSCKPGVAQGTYQTWSYTSQPRVIDYGGQITWFEPMDQQGWGDAVFGDAVCGSGPGCFAGSCGGGGRRSRR